MNTRRSGPRRKPHSELLWRLRDWGWGIGIGAAVLIVAAGLIFLLSRSAASASTIDGIQCDATEQVQYHVHAHVTIYVNGQEVTVPGGIGITNTCLYWLHTHDSGGIVHVEAPSQTSFTLGQFFAVWGQPLSSTQLLGDKADASHQVKAYVNGTPWTGDPASIPLSNHSVIVLEYGPPFPAPPAYTFPAGY